MDLNETYSHLQQRIMQDEEVLGFLAGNRKLLENLNETLSKMQSEVLRENANLVKEHDNLVADVLRINNEVAEIPIKPSREHMLKSFGSLQFWIVIVSLVIGGKIGLFPWIVNIVGGWSWIAIGLGGVFFSLFIYGFNIEIRKKIRNREQEIRNEIARSKGLDNYQSRLKSIEEELEKALLASLKGIAREFIAQHLPPKLDKTLMILHWGGLSDVHDRLLVVRTRAHDDLESLVKRMGEGTIGIAGPRGSGKSTLLDSLTRDDASAEKRRLSMLVSAPIRYDVRDFILYLFSNLCHAVLERCGISISDLRTIDKEAPLPDWSKSSPLTKIVHSFGPKLIWTLSAFLLLGGITGHVLQQMINDKTGVATEQQTPSTIILGEQSPNLKAASTTLSQPSRPDARPDTRKDPSANAEASSANLGPKERANSISTSTNSGQPKPTFAPPAAHTKKTGRSKTPFDFLLANRNNLLNGGIAALVVALASTLKLGGRRLWEMFVDLPKMSAFEALLTSKNLHENEQRLARISYDNIQNIRFQHSYSTGWKGSLSLPNLSAEQTSAETLSQNQRTLPDIVTDFRQFVATARNGLGLEQPIMIAIDEMDKMKAPEDAESFLNDIKAIFSIPHCIYMISISENAMSNFERRGLPFRDTFDSSFHQVVRVKHLNIEESIRLLDRRVVGLPRPFQGLCHCLSGGLARDLVRVARQLPLEDQGQSLVKVKERLIHEEIEGKLDAIQIAISNITVEPQLRNFVALLRNLRVKKLDNSKQITNELWEVSLPNSFTDKNENDFAEAKNQLSTIRSRSRELASYVYYLDSVDKLHDMEPHESMYVIDGPVDRLARARQELEVNPWAGWELISGLREEIGHAKWNLPEIKVAVSSTQEKKEGATLHFPIFNIQPNRGGIGGY